ncbi:hypothetical protein E2C01_030391 [Portunus trituberculatus]|uniref:Uncharacterized protein n=1 Tax=Portunus trituberculatus TaxID=210409 RepID=A0A5B7ERY2_PORTR|nr:hypothetical protein [Portunus trituberculatus]
MKGGSTLTSLSPSLLSVTRRGLHVIWSHAGCPSTNPPSVASTRYPPYTTSERPPGMTTLPGGSQQGLHSHLSTSCHNATTPQQPHCFSS